MFKSGQRAADISDIMTGYTLEATAPTAAEIRELSGVVPRGKALYLSAIHGRPTAELIAAATEARKAGLEPVPHIVARSYTSDAELQHVLKRLTNEAGVKTALVLAGDVPEPCGPFVDALSVITSDHLQKAGITEIGVSSYPDGHPKIDNNALQAALPAKLVAAKARGLKVHVASQFCFDADRIIAWLKGLRAQNITVPIRIGLAGPTSVKKLMRYALKCGVRTSAKAMFSAQAAALLTAADPSDILEELTNSPEIASLGEIYAHIYSFGGLVATGSWAEAAAMPKGAELRRSSM